MPNKHDQCPNCPRVKDARAKLCRKCEDALPGIPHSERLLAKVRIVDTSCWNFTGFRLPNGYGRIKGFGNKPVLAHRFSYELYNGTIPPGIQVCHTCDNRACVNPNHLFLGTASDNMQDMVRKGRRRPPTESPKTRNMAHWKARLTEAQVAEIRQRKHEPRKVLAAEFGTSPRYISSVICGTKRKYA